MSISVSFAAPVVAQALIGVGALVAFAAAPPVEGKMMLVSLSGASTDRIAGLALESGMQIVDRGPNGSLVVAGRAGDIIGTALRHGVIVIAAPAAGCGTKARP